MVLAFASINYYINVENSDDLANQSEEVLMQDIIDQCQEIHIVMASAGYNATRSSTTMFKSLLFYRKNPIHFHLIVDQISQKILRTLFDTWEIPHLQVSYYLTEDVVSDVALITKASLADTGLYKLAIPQIIPNTVDRVIVIEPEVNFAENVAELWKLFDEFAPEQTIGFAANQNDFAEEVDQLERKWPVVGRGYNTGVILMDLFKLRREKTASDWATGAKELIESGKVNITDREVFNAVLFSNQRSAYQLPCEWNIQLSRTSQFDVCHPERNGMKLIYWNTPVSELDVRDDMEYFYNHYLIFSGLDGTLLRKQLSDCKTIEVDKSVAYSMFDPTEDCFEFRKAAVLKYRTHLYYLDFDLGETDDASVTWVAQLSLDRLQMLESLFKSWDGPASLTLYLSDVEVEPFQNFVAQSPVLSGRKNIGYHVVYKHGEYYPYNILRNIALDQVLTPFVFLSDIDFLPMPNSYPVFKKYIRSSKLSEGKKLLVIPAFETRQYKAKIPESKAELISQMDNKEIFIFRYDTYARGHKPTDFPRWFNESESYQVKWKWGFEPYVIVRSDVLRYDLRWVCYAFNKESHFVELSAMDYEFHIIPDSFIVHLVHAQSMDCYKQRTHGECMRCTRLLKKEYNVELNEKYNKTLKFYD